MLANIVKKRGLSQVVSTVLLIMLTIAAVSMLAAFIIPFVKNSLTKSTECNGLDTSFSFDESFDFNCQSLNTNTGTYNITFSISRGNDQSEEVGGFLTTFYSTDESRAVQVIHLGTPTSDIMMFNKTSVKLEIPKSGETRTYLFNANTKSYSKVEVRAVLKSGRVCEKISDSIRITSCA